MHIYFSAIGGAGIGPLAQVAQQAGYQVSGSDLQDTQYIHYLKHHGITDIHIGQSREQIAAVHNKHPIDWFVHSSAVSADAPELQFCAEQQIKISKRDEFLNQILSDKQLQLIAIAGTHGKTTTTALITWLFQQIAEPASHLLPAKTSFTEMGEFNTDSPYFVYEADEFDRNFLAFQPAISIITGVSWDHHELFPTREDYQDAFREFLDQSAQTFIWQEDADYLGLESDDRITILDSGDQHIETISLLGHYNRLDAWLAIQAVQRLTKQSITKLVDIVNHFPGLSRRMEQLVPNLYTDYAHTPEKIRGAMSVASELAAQAGQSVVVVYEPLTNRRQHYMLDDYGDCFDGASQIYWIPSYLAREDPSQRVIEPSELISHLTDPTIAQPMLRNAELKKTIQSHLDNNDLVIGMAGGGGSSLDDWLRQQFL